MHKIIGRIIGGWGCKHCSSFVRLALSMSEINENVFKIDIKRYFRKYYPAFKLSFIVSIHFFLHTEQLLKANITEHDSSWNSRHNLCSSHTFVHFASGYFPSFHTLHNPDSSCSIIFKTLAYLDSNQSFARHWHIHTPINLCKTWAYQDFDQSFARFGHIRTLINHLQDIGISGLRSIICKTLV